MFLITTESFGQIFRVRAGLTLSNMIYKAYGNELRMKPGFHIGPTIEFPPNDFYSFEMGLNLSTKGFKFSEKGAGYEYQHKLNLLYFDIPLTAKVTYDADFSKFFGALGPYFGWGIAGKWKYTETNNGKTNTDVRNVKWGLNGTGDLARFDFGLTFRAGLEIKSLQIGLSYGLGLANISSYTGGGNEVRNRILEISVGYKP